MNRLILIRAIVIFCVIGLTGCSNLPRIYSVGGNYGWVIDSASSNPLNDVIVLEIWELRGGTGLISETGFTGILLLRESVTDENGYYYFEPKGPLFTVSGRLSVLEPALIYYKKGYGFKRLTNINWKRGQDGKDSKWKGETIKLNTFKGTGKDYNEMLHYYSKSLYTGYNRSDLNCLWTKIPRFTAALIKERPEKTRQRQINYIPPNHLLESENCNDPELILKEYLK